MIGLDLFAEAAAGPKPLRAHQHKAIAMLKRSLLAGNRRVVLQMPTGAGKTRVAAEIVNGALAKGNRVCFTVPAISLIDQTIEAFAGEGIHAVGVIQAQHARTDANQPVQVASVQSLARRSRPQADVIVIDEAHLQFKAVKAWIRDDPKKTFIGLTATPWARGMANDWQDLVSPVSMQELIDTGLLSRFRVYAPSHPDLSKVSTVAGDYHEGQLAEVMSAKRLVADVVETWCRLAQSRPTLVFAVNCAHAQQLQAEFAASGICMGYCDAYVDLPERQMLFDRMACGELKGIVNVGTLTTGVDADVRCVVMARPTKSEMLFVQSIGRGLRPAPGKTECLIIDHADNHARLGFVTSIHHHKLLGGAEKQQKKKKDGETLPRECKSCGVMKPRGACPNCGFEPKRQSEIEYEDGELVEITPAASKPVMADKQRWYSELLGVAQARGRSPGWAYHSFRKKFGIYPANSLSKIAVKPTGEVIAFARHLDIAFAKARK